MDSIQEKALKMALTGHNQSYQETLKLFIVCTSQKISVFTSNCLAPLMLFES
jgi:hypothetical protein